LVSGSGGEDAIRGHRRRAKGRHLAQRTHPDGLAVGLIQRVQHSLAEVDVGRDEHHAAHRDHRIDSADGLAGAWALPSPDLPEFGGFQPDGQVPAVAVAALVCGPVLNRSKREPVGQSCRRSGKGIGAHAVAASAHLKLAIADAGRQCAAQGQIDTPACA
jgi:hypothetical protein